VECLLPFNSETFIFHYLTDISKKQNKEICNFAFVLCACDIWFHTKGILKIWGVLKCSAEDEI
jgi:hypothetical protein